MLQIQCKLFVFDKNSQSWVERGRGLLRLNDMASTDDGTLQSRLGKRSQGRAVLGDCALLVGSVNVAAATSGCVFATAMWKQLDLFSCFNL